MSEPIPDFVAVVPAGGSGTRLWPLSRRHRPKFLLDLGGTGRSLLGDTLERLRPLVGVRALVVTGARHADAVRADLPGLPDGQVLIEPSPRDSMAAIGLAAAVLERQDPDLVLGSFAADHVVPDPEPFRDAVREAVAVARTGRLVTIGLEPTRPATGFGYIQVGEPLAQPDAPSARQVRCFVEKPDAERARAFLEAGDHRWNAGMFVVRAGVLLDLLAREHPDLAAGLREIAASDVDPEVLERVWPGLTSISIDHAVAEPAARTGEVAVVPAAFGWDDVGDFRSLEAVLAAGGAESAGSTEGPVQVLGDRDRVLARDASGLVVPAGGRTVTVLGLADVVVVDTPDAVLVTGLAHAQDVRGLAADLPGLGRDDLT